MAETADNCAINGDENSLAEHQRRQRQTLRGPASVAGAMRQASETRRDSLRGIPPRLRVPLPRSTRISVSILSNRAGQSDACFVSRGLISI